MIRIFALLVACVTLTSCASTPCHTVNVPWTDYDDDGQLLGVRSVPLTICQGVRR